MNFPKVLEKEDAGSYVPQSVVSEEAKKTQLKILEVMRVQLQLGNVDNVEKLAQAFVNIHVNEW